MARAAHSVRTAPSGDAAGGRYHRVRHNRDNGGTATAAEAGVRAAAASVPSSDATASAKRGAGAGGSTRGSRAGAGAGTRAAAARASPPRCAYLEYTGPQPADGPSPDPYIPFNQPVLTIGRHPQLCDVLVYRKHADFHLSRRHCQVASSTKDGVVVWTIKDLGSTNGVYVNGHRLPASAPHELHDGDTVHLGSLQIMPRTQKQPDDAGSGPVQHVFRFTFHRARHQARGTPASAPRVSTTAARRRRPSSGGGTRLGVSSPHALAVAGSGHRPAIIPPSFATALLNGTRATGGVSVRPRGPPGPGDIDAIRRGKPSGGQRKRRRLSTPTSSPRSAADAAVGTRGSGDDAAGGSAQAARPAGWVSPAAAQAMVDRAVAAARAAADERLAAAVREARADASAQARASAAEEAAAEAAKLAAANAATEAAAKAAKDATKAAERVAVERARRAVDAELREELTCGLCHDVLLDPVVLECSHGFCQTRCSDAGPRFPFLRCMHLESVLAVMHDRSDELADSGSGADAGGPGQQRRVPVSVRAAEHKARLRRLGVDPVAACYEGVARPATADAATQVLPSDAPAGAAGDDSAGLVPGAHATAGAGASAGASATAAGAAIGTKGGSGSGPGPGASVHAAEGAVKRAASALHARGAHAPSPAPGSAGGATGGAGTGAASKPTQRTAARVEVAPASESESDVESGLESETGSDGGSSGMESSDSDEDDIEVDDFFGDD